MLPADASPELREAAGLRTQLIELRRAITRLSMDDHLPHTGSSQTDTDAGVDVAAGDLQGMGREASARAAELAASLRAHLAEHERVQTRLGALLADPQIADQVDSAFTERASILRTVVAAEQEWRGAQQQSAAAARISAEVSRAGAQLTRVDAHRIAELRAAASRPESAWHRDITSPAVRDRVLAALGRQRLLTARAQLAAGLLLTDQMRDIIAEALPALLQGEPVLLLGETGGAKTALAEYLSQHGVGREPELISGFGDITSAQVIGTHELRAVAGATVSTFVPGPLLRAMTEGRPVVLDEINAMPPEFLKRLNRILQLRPGDRMTVQENAGSAVVIQPGFAVLATANEQTPHRYRGIDRMSAELTNRFGAHAYRVHYPDAGVAYTALPTENALLAAAAVALPDGTLPAHLTMEQLIRVARAAFISQQVFSGTHGTGFDDYLSTERAIDDRPGLEESVLAPRTLVAIVRKVALSAGTVTLDRALSRFVNGVMHREDRQVLALILSGQGFQIG